MECWRVIWEKMRNDGRSQEAKSRLRLGVRGLEQGRVYYCKEEEMTVSI